MKLDQKGFGIVEILVVLATVVLIVVSGWFVWQRQAAEPTSPLVTTAPQDSPQINYTDCHTEANSIDRTLDNGMALYKWKSIDHAKVFLADWGVSLTLPEAIVDTAVCRYSSNGYVLSTDAIVNDVACVAHYRLTELTDEGVQIWRYSAYTPAEGQIYGATGTLNDYYEVNKSADGNYVTDPLSGHRYYKVGSSFYVAFGDTKESLETNKTARASACQNEKPDFSKVFVDAMTTLQVQ